jgi:hypothetical protein
VVARIPPDCAVAVYALSVSDAFRRSKFQFIDGSSDARSTVRDLLFRRLAFANLIRFSGPLSLPYIREIARHRRTNFGSFCVEALEFVQTDKLFSGAGTTTIDR